MATWTVWDVNGYYGSLGFRFGDRPSKRQLRHAFERLRGHDNARLTEILHVLLRQRAEYDRCAFGEPFYDRMFTEFIKRVAERLAGAAGRAQRDVLDDWGFRDLPEDFDELEREFLADPSSPRRSSWATVVWPWSWYADRTESVDLVRLSVWQQALVRHLRVARFSVGLSGYGDPVSARVIGGDWVVFLRDDQIPDEGRARQAARQVHTSATYALQDNNRTRRTMKYIGGSAAVKIVEAETNSGFGGGRKHPYISSVLKNKDDSVILRFLDNPEMGVDEENFWITLATHDYVPVKPAPASMDADKKKKWPETMTAICRTQQQLQGEYDNCYICENLTKDDKNGKPRPWSKSGTTFARAIHRERVKITQADVDAGNAPAEALGKWAMRDVMVEMDELDDKGDPTGRKVSVPEIFLVQQKWSNFFQQISIMSEEYDGTILDRDIKMTRTGVKLETAYTPTPLNQTPNFDLSDPETRAPFDKVFPWSDLIEFIDNLHSDRYFGRFFDPSYIDPDEEKKSSRPASSTSVVYEDVDEAAPARPTSNGISQEKMDALKARMGGAKKSEPSVETDDGALANA